MAHFKFADTVTCFNPAFRISFWTYGTLPEVILLDNQTLTKGYQNGPRLARPQNPLETGLGSNYPNPFNPVTTLRLPPGVGRPE